MRPLMQETLIVQSEEQAKPAAQFPPPLFSFASSSDTSASSGEKRETDAGGTDRTPSQVPSDERLASGHRVQSDPQRLPISRPSPITESHSGVRSGLEGTAKAKAISQDFLVGPVIRCSDGRRKVLLLGTSHPDPRNGILRRLPSITAARRLRTRTGYQIRCLFACRRSQRRTSEAPNNSARSSAVRGSGASELTIRIAAWLLKLFE